MGWLARRLARLLPLWIAFRYLQARRRNRYFSFVSLVSVLGLVLGVAALTLVLSVMNGFGHELRYRILGAVPHVLVTGPGALAEWEEISAQVRRHVHVAGAAPFYEAEGIVSHGGVVAVASLFGIDPRLEAPLTIIDDHMVSGRFDALDDVEAGVIMGVPLAFQLGLVKGDELTLVVPAARGSSVAPKLLQVTLVGTFELNSEVDNGLLVMHVDTLSSLDLGRDARSGVQFELDDVLQARSAAARIARLEPHLTVRDWGARYGELFRAVGMEKALMFLLLAVVIAIATFNIISSLVMLVDDKQGDIAILRTMGMGRAAIVRVFVMQGTLIGIIGVASGLALGYVLAIYITQIVEFFEQLAGVRLLAGTYFDEVPSLVEVGDLVWIGALAFALALLATIHPSRRALQVNPAVALHRE